MREKEIKVLVDIDGTLNEILDPFIEKVLEMGYKYDYEYRKSYDMENGIQKKNPRNVLIEIFNEPSFWINLPVASNSYEGLYYLNSTYDTYIATTPWNEENKTLKKKWIKKHFPFFNTDRIIFSDKKWDLEADVIIEDKPENLEKCKKAGMKAICKVQPYNTETNPDAFLDDWKDIYDVMEEVLTK